MKIQRWVQMVWPAVLMVVAVSLGCSGEKEELTQQDFEGFSSHGQRILEVYDWSQFEDHPIKTSLQECLFVDGQMMAFMQRMMAPGSESSYEDGIAPVFGIDLEGMADEFARKEERERLTQLVEDLLRRLVGHALCVEIELYLDEYDFDGQRLQLSRGEAIRYFRDDLPVKGDVDFDYGDYVPPIALRLEGLAEALTLPRAQAQRLLVDLERVVEVVDEGEEEDAERPDQSAYFTEPPIDLLPSQTIEALTWAELFSYFGGDGQVDQDLLAGLEARLSPVKGARKVEGIAVFRLRPSLVDSDRYIWNVDIGDQSLPIGQVVGWVEQLALRTPNSDAIGAVWPVVERPKVGHRIEEYSATDWSVGEINESHRPIFDAICDAGVREDEGSYFCQTCPIRGAGGGRLEFLSIGAGSFQFAGAQEVLVQSQGCGGRWSDPSGFMILMRKGLDGQWRRLDTTKAEYSRCEFLPTSFGTALPLCTTIPDAEKGSTAAKFLVNSLGERIGTVELAEERDDKRLGCGSTYTTVSVTEFGLTPQEDRDLFAMSLKVTTGRTTDGSDRCFGEPEFDVTEDMVRLEYQVYPSGIVKTESTVEAEIRLRRLVRGGQR